MINTVESSYSFNGLTLERSNFHSLVYIRELPIKVLSFQTVLH